MKVPRVPAAPCEANMDIRTFSRSRLEEGLNIARAGQSGHETIPRVLFAPSVVGEANFEQACSLYGRLSPGDFNQVVIVESVPGSEDARIAVSSLDRFETPLGEVVANDRLRNEFCDEDDDFYVDDGREGCSPALTTHLMMLQIALGDYTAVSIRLQGDEPFLIREAAGALDELLGNRPALVVCCCHLPSRNREAFDRIQTLLDKGDLVGLMTLLGSEPIALSGSASFTAGALLCQSWNLGIQFGEAPDATTTTSTPDEDSLTAPSLLAGCAHHVQASAALG